MQDIDRKEFESFVLEGWTVKELQEFYDLSRTSVYAYKKKWDLINKTPNNSLARTFGKVLETKLCVGCNLELSFDNFYSNGYTPKGTQKFKPKCKSCTLIDRNDNFTINITDILAEMGKLYKCEVCGYDKNSAALNFHHPDPSVKEVAVSELAKSSSKETLRKEIEKCIVLCANCHMEEHYPNLNKR